ncbi:MAG TPA: DUF6174 domain-containing protein [Anaerolineales bacterium]|nr:DUF6174 domain-containing protein [Anaerolineales bacterium]
MKIIRLIFLISIALLTACAPATPSKEDINNQLEDLITSENALWDSLNIQSYRMKIHDRTNWVEFSATITVENSKVIGFDASCGKAIIDIDGKFCEETLPNIVPATYTIQGLFDQLKKSRANFEAREYVTSSWSDSISITFDPEYHFPNLINFDVPEAADEEYTVTVLIFEILPKK